MDFQIEKRLVQEFYKSIEMSNPQNIPSVLKKYCSETLIWRGFHPFNMIRGPEEVGKKFWYPLLKSLKKCQRREDIFFAGLDMIDKKVTEINITSPTGMRQIADYKSSYLGSFFYDQLSKI